MQCLFATRAPGLVTALLAGALLVPRDGGGEAPFSHRDWTRVLRTYVDERGAVDYEALSKSRGDLDGYLASLRRTSPVSDPALFPTREERLAYWINAYNAAVFEGVLARGPETKSVWSGGLIPGYSFFVRRTFVLGGARTNLKTLEDETLRSGFSDPRVHAALNCASRGCPRLPRKAFEPATLDAELDAAMGLFVSEERNVSWDRASRTVRLSKIFDWFSEDFLAYERARGRPDPGLIDYVNRYRAPDAQLPRDARIRFLPYDKRLNGR